MGIEIKQVVSKRDKRTFVRMAWDIYKGNRQWVPFVYAEELRKMDKAHYPFFEHSDADWFLAYKDGRVAGRIAAILNNNHNAVHGENIGFFGFFECIDDQAVADALFDRAAAWCKSRGATAVRGPANYSVNDEYGLLLDAFDMRPIVMCPYNHEYYPRLVEGWGFTRVMKLLCHHIDITTFTAPEKVMRMQELILRRNKGKYRYLVPTRHNKDRIVAQLKRIYDSAWEANWGAVKTTQKEWEYIISHLLQIVDWDFVILIEDDTENIVAFQLVLPDMNEPWAHTSGHYTPWSLLKFLWWKRKMEWIRLTVTGILPEHRMKGLDALLYAEIVKVGISKGYKHCDISWQLETNHMILNAIENFGGKEYKRYGIFQKDI